MQWRVPKVAKHEDGKKVGIKAKEKGIVVIIQSKPWKLSQQVSSK